MIDIDLTTEQEIINSILGDTQPVKDAAYWEEHYRKEFHPDPPKEEKRVVVWTTAYPAPQKKPWYLRECIRFRSIIVPLQVEACKRHGYRRKWF